MKGWIYIIMMLVLEISNYQIKASKINMVSDTLKDEIITYWNEAHYPDDEDTGVIESDLKNTLELDFCNVFKII